MEESLGRNVKETLLALGVRYWKGTLKVETTRNEFDETCKQLGIVFLAGFLKYCSNFQPLPTKTLPRVFFMFLNEFHEFHFIPVCIPKRLTVVGSQSSVQFYSNFPSSSRGNIFLMRSWVVLGPIEDSELALELEGLELGSQRIVKIRNFWNSGIVKILKNSTLLGFKYYTSPNMSVSTLSLCLNMV